MVVGVEVTDDLVDFSVHSWALTHKWKNNYIFQIHKPKEMVKVSLILQVYNRDIYPIISEILLGKTTIKI